jgi:hypothetical protein
MIESAVIAAAHFTPILAFVLALAARLGWECGGALVALARSAVGRRR